MRSRLFIAGATVIVSLIWLAATANGAGYVADDLYSLNGITSVPSSVAIGGQAGGSILSFSPTVTSYATIWNSSTPVNLNPAAFSGSNVLGTSGGQQVGDGTLSGSAGTLTAVLWTGSAASAVILNPPGSGGCVALGTNGSQQVGSGLGGAILWNGSATSYVSLIPTGGGYTSSVAQGTDGSQQVGFAFGIGAQENDHAMLWSGTAASYVDLQPAGSGYSSSQAYGVNGGQQVGYADSTSSGTPHAMLWFGTAASYVDLNPAGASQSGAEGTNGTEQVGDAEIQGVFVAAVWNGTANSFVNLGVLLPSQFTSSEAFSIDAQGDVFGYAETSSGTVDDIEWVVTPEPGSAAILFLGPFALLARRRRRPA